METNSTKLSLRQPLMFLSVFVLIVIILIGLLSIADQRHKQDVYKRYADETNLYINNNKSALIQLFTEVFPNTDKCNTSFQENTCSRADAEQIARLLPSTLKDWSSTFFIKKTAANQLLYMRLSGEVYQFSSSPEQRTDIEQLLAGTKDMIPWDQYGYILNTKQIIIPVKDTNNNIIGAIVRGVIE